MNINKIGSIQIDLLKKSKNFLTLQKSEGFDVSCHPSCYLTSWSKEYGNFVLKSLNEKTINIYKIYFNLKEIYKQYKFAEIKIYQKNSLKKNFNKIVVTGCLPDDFKKKGHYHDRYFSMKAKDNKDTLWIVICHDANMKIPEKFDNNIIVIKNKSDHIINFFFRVLKNIFCFFF